ncbi:MAG: septum formation initiator family protein [Lachnospiraceae bacterium]|nr:septum formation initiator family protein [Lachnospiraceae bacterium]
MGTISKRKYKRRNRTSKIWISLIVVLMVGVFSVRSFTLWSAGKENVVRKEKLEKELEKEKKREQELKEEEKYRQTKKYIEDYAHNQLGLVYPGEIIFKSQE